MISEMVPGQSGPWILIKSEPLERETRKRITWKAPRKSGPKGSDRVGIAGKGNAEADYLESAGEIGYGNGLIESETQDR
ncbi:hypothetical protein ACWGKW_44215, partial [Streptomyces sp. NPDC054766]